jgi:proteasome lid subunit RPN8/RPN11
VIRIPRKIHDDIVEHARGELPNECCGYLGGTRSESVVEVTSRYAMSNVDASPEHFSFDPKEQFAAFKLAREKGEDLVANYHSHPETPARMSDEDIRLANDSSTIYFIYSVADNKLKAFMVDADRNVSEQNLAVTD